MSLREIETRQGVNFELRGVLVSLEGVSLKLGETQILNPIDLKVQDIVRPGVAQGQVIGILGPSGCGKTQFSHVLAGLRPPTTGVVKIADEKGVLHPVQPGKVGYVFQNYPLFIHRTVLGNLLVALERTPLSKDERVKLAMGELEAFDLADKAKAYPDQLSGGQKQRVAILQQLLGAGHYLIMDEPFTGLDPIRKDLVCDLIRKVSTTHENTTIFIIAHDIEALAAVSDQLWLMGKDAPNQGSYFKKGYNLISRGFAWNPESVKTDAFHHFVDEVKDQFQHLSV